MNLRNFAHYMLVRNKERGDTRPDEGVELPHTPDQCVEFMKSLTDDQFDQLMCTIFYVSDCERDPEVIAMTLMF